MSGNQCSTAVCGLFFRLSAVNSADEVSLDENKNTHYEQASCCLYVHACLLKIEAESSNHHNTSSASQQPAL
jgi:hypothetical protein